MPEYIEIKTGESIQIDFDGFRASVCRRDVGEDGGYSIELQGPAEEREVLLRWDVFRKDPHYHVPASEAKQINIDSNSPEESLDFVIDCFATQLPAMLKRAEYADFSEKVDQSRMPGIAAEVRKATTRAPEPSSTRRFELTPEILERMGKQ